MSEQMLVRKNTPDEMIEVISAAKAGKVIEYSGIGNGVKEARWSVGEPQFNFGVAHYRVKKEPREIWVNDYGTWFSSPHNSKEKAERALALGGGKATRFREVLE